MIESEKKDVCPKCGSKNLEMGYGFAYGGGIGSYTFCGDCDEFIKKEFDDVGAP